MNARGFGFETAPTPPDAAAERREGDARPAMRAAPPDKDDPHKDDDQRGDEPADEPGYGHGV
jgi:hypothetical protein